MHFTLSTLIQKIFNLSYFNPLLNNFIMGDYTVVKPCLASVFSFMLLGISYQFKSKF
jgi:hypothetical protein